MTLEPSDEVTLDLDEVRVLLHQLGLDRSPSEMTPERQQLILVNKDEVEAAVREAGASERTESEGSQRREH